MKSIKLFILWSLTISFSNAQDTIYYTSFEGDSLEWKIKGLGSGILSDSFYNYAGDTTKGFEDEDPRLSRVFHGKRSWQVNDNIDTVLFEQKIINGFTDVQFCFRFSATALNLGQGLDDNDSIMVFVSNSNTGFDSIPVLIIHGDNNNSWGFDADSVIQVSADSHSIFTIPEGVLDTANTSSTTKISIPLTFGDTIYIMMIVKNNQNKEVWNIDQVLLTGKKVVPLAIHLASFDVKKQDDGKVQINWQSWHESQCVQYIVQKSMNINNFMDIDSVLCKNTDVLSTYTVLDNHPGSGRIYYRLKVIHTNTIDYTDWISVPLDLNQKNRVYPTFVSNHVFLTTTAERSTYLIIDLTGKIVQSGSLHSKALHQVGLYNVLAGVYKIILSDEKSRVYSTIIKS